MKFQFANRASSQLAAPLTVEGTSITLSPGTGDRFPANLTPGTPAQLTLINRTGSSEVVRAVNRSGDILDILRGQEGTAVLAFPETSLVELRLTAEVLNSFLPLDGGTMSGELDMAYYPMRRTNLLGGSFIEYVSTHSVASPDNNATTAIELPPGGVHPRINTASILTTQLLFNAVFLWWGLRSQLPPYLKICDGSAGTPNLQGRFVLGASSDGDLGEFGGAFDIRSGLGGEHDHSGATINASLGAFNLPGLSAPSLNVTHTKILASSLAAAQPTEASRDMVSAVSMAGGGSYIGSQIHAHAIPNVGPHDHAVSLRPPYFKLHFVMFRAWQIN